jgi:hypothetical protein
MRFRHLVFDIVCPENTRMWANGCRDASSCSVVNAKDHDGDETGSDSGGNGTGDWQYEKGFD